MINYDGTLWQPKFMPFGLKQGSRKFQSIMREVLGETASTEDSDAGVTVYIDDILIYAKSEEAMGRKFDEVLSKLATAGMKIKMKSAVWHGQYQILGHEITSDGVKIPEERIQQLLELNVSDSLRNWKLLANRLLSQVHSRIPGPGGSTQ